MDPNGSTTCTCSTFPIENGVKFTHEDCSPRSDHAQPGSKMRMKVFFTSKVGSLFRTNPAGLCSRSDMCLLFHQVVTTEWKERTIFLPVISPRIPGLKWQTLETPPGLDIFILVGYVSFLNVKLLQ